MNDSYFFIFDFFSHFFRPSMTVFYPYFDILDRSNNDVIPYTGRYLLKAVGAGPSLDTVQTFTDEEIDMYNNQER